MQANPLLGVIFHWIGGLAAASFYLPYRAVRSWSWETYWLVGGFFAWIVVPHLICMMLVPDMFDILGHAPPAAFFWTIFFGIVWGFGGITYGLTMRYLGIGLGIAVSLGCCAAFGTLIPPIFHHEFGTIAHTTSGQIVLLGVAMCIVGIFVSGLAGMSKERELPSDVKSESITEFHFARGMVMAILAGVLSAAFAFGLDAGAPIAALAKESLLRTGRADLWQNLPVLILVMLGGFITNLIYCMALGWRNGSLPQYVQRKSIGLNYLWCAIAGVTWYLQFFFYSMGQTRMGAYAFSSWTMHMASIIIFGTLWGIALKEWRGTSRRTHFLVMIGLIVLVASTAIVGYGNYLKVKG